MLADVVLPAGMVPGKDEAALKALIQPFGSCFDKAIWANRTKICV